MRGCVTDELQRVETLVHDHVPTCEQGREHTLHQPSKVVDGEVVEAVDWVRERDALELAAKRGQEPLMGEQRALPGARGTGRVDDGHRVRRPGWPVPPWRLAVHERGEAQVLDDAAVDELSEANVWVALSEVLDDGPSVASMSVWQPKRPTGRASRST